jgi:hypothetical protein
MIEIGIPSKKAMYQNMPPRPRKIKIPKGELRKLFAGKKTSFDYGVTFKTPVPVGLPMTVRNKFQRLVGYNADGSLLFAPFKSSSNAKLRMSSQNDFMATDQVPNSSIFRFTLFNKLPIEIRVYIWNKSLPSDRMITINKIDVFSIDKRLADYADGTPRGTYKVECNNPGMLSACKESRGVALQTYKLSFEPRLSGRPIYFDKERDFLFFEDTDTLNMFTGYPFELGRDFKKVVGDLLGVKHMIVGKDVDKLTVKILGLYEGLKTIIFQQQIVNTTFGPSRLHDREAMVFSDLAAPKSIGGAGRLGCLIRFESQLLLKLVAENTVWRAGMLDM